MLERDGVHHDRRFYLIDTRGRMDRPRVVFQGHQAGQIAAYNGVTWAIDNRNKILNFVKGVSETRTLPSSATT